MRFRILSLYSLAILGLVLGLLAGSQSMAATPANISVKVAPENPAPYENASIILSSYSYNLDTVMITWFVDGKNVSSGIGKKSLSVTVGGAGSTTNVMAKMDFPDGATEVRAALRPAVIILLVEAMDSYVPPFYKGKALPPAEGYIKVVAMPEIKSGNEYLNSKNMTYSWKKDYSNVPNSSGYGKNFFVYTNDYLDDQNTLSVTASSVDGRYSSSAETTVGTTPPQISFYKKDKDLGILWESTIENGHTIVGEEVVVASPYFIAPRQIMVPSLLFNWSLNGTYVPTESYRKNILPIRVSEGTSGQSKIRLDIESTDRIFQTASREIDVQF